MKYGYHANIEALSVANKNFREVLYTSQHMQLVLMTLLPWEAIGLETHSGNDQFFRVETGMWLCVINGKEYVLESGSGIIVPQGAQHNITNTSTTEPLALYTIYTPPHHKDWIIRATKQDASDHEELFDGKTTE